MSEIIQCLNTQLFLKYGVNWLISYQLLALKNNDLTPHMSSHTNCASLFWQKVLPEIHSANFFDLPFFTENHELFFQPKHNKKERVDQSCPNSYTPAILNINVSPQPVPPADTLEKLSDVSSHNTAETHTCFFALDPDTIISSVKPSIFSVSSSSDYYCFTGEDDSDIKVALNVAISNYEQYNTSFPTITQIHALFSQTEFFMQYHLRKKISAIGEFALLWSANNHILFAVKSPHSLENCMEIIHTEYNRFFNSSPITALCAHIYFSSNRIPKPVKSPLTAMHDYCVFDGEVISWDTLSLILDTAQKIISLVKNCSVVDQKKFYMGLQRFTQCGIFSFDTIKDIPELLQSVHNKRLMAKWILHMQKGIHNER
ncbi:hypothetical protein KDK77_07595 [bacterium]|nr:hypothetical protein [bacterium]